MCPYCRVFKHTICTWLSHIVAHTVQEYFQCTKCALYNMNECNLIFLELCKWTRPSNQSLSFLLTCYCCLIISRAILCAHATTIKRCLILTREELSSVLSKNSILVHFVHCIIIYFGSGIQLLFSISLATKFQLGPNLGWTWSN